ncbi:MAG: ABC transporter ATP-binding protein [Proteobacteria bacterium]|nr:ABC transporter ATP-binding protein [Pseudomonadota bacterium]
MLQPALTAAPMVEASDVRYHFVARRNLWRPASTVRAVDGVSFAIPAGRTFGIVGESGCGKSTLASLLIGDRLTQQGSIRIDGRTVEEHLAQGRKAYARTIQMVAQDPFGTMDPRQKVGPQIDETIAIHFPMSRAARRERTVRMLRSVGLAESVYTKMPHQISGGQRQRVAIARALVVEPKVLICDEPTSALDVSIQAQVLNLLLRLQAEFGLTIILISHDIRVVGHMSHEIGVMSAGIMVEQGPTRQVIKQPRNAYSRALFDAAPGAGRLMRGAAEAAGVVGEG